MFRCAMRKETAGKKVKELKIASAAIQVQEAQQSCITEMKGCKNNEAGNFRSVVIT